MYRLDSSAFFMGLIAGLVTLFLFNNINTDIFSDTQKEIPPSIQDLTNKTNGLMNQINTLTIQNEFFKKNVTQLQKTVNSLKTQNEELQNTSYHFQYQQTNAQLLEEIDNRPDYIILAFLTFLVVSCSTFFIVTFIIRRSQTNTIQENEEQIRKLKKQLKEKEDLLKTPNNL
jgi:peptidoglycan hydrolase CwlO-like protein